LSSIQLELKSVSVDYGAIQALQSISFEIHAGEIVTLIGANGAGKTSTLRAISGLSPVSSGEILFQGQSILGLAPHKISQQGIIHAPEGRGIFLNLSVEENLDLGAWNIKDKTTIKQSLQTVFELFPRLKERRKQNAGTLSGGEQQMLAIGRAIMSQPKLLLLDEPSLGLAPQVIELIFEIIKKINSTGQTILLVEQNATQALQIANRGIVLETGKLVMSALASKLLNSEFIKKAYLG
jgi:branched-chain amino acid transport system ATP-binding protein